MIIMIIMAMIIMTMTNDDNDYDDDLPLRLWQYLRWTWSEDTKVPTVEFPIYKLYKFCPAKIMNCVLQKL